MLALSPILIFNFENVMLMINKMPNITSIAFSLCEVTFMNLCV